MSAYIGRGALPIVATLAALLAPARARALEPMVEPAPPNRGLGLPLQSGRSARPRSEVTAAGSFGHGTGSDGVREIVAQDQSLALGARVVSGRMQLGVDLTVLSRSALRVRGEGSDKATALGQLRLEVQASAVATEVLGGRVWISPAIVATLPTGDEKPLSISSDLPVIEARALDSWTTAATVRASLQRGWLSLHGEQLVALVHADDERTEELGHGAWWSMIAVGARASDHLGVFAQLEAQVEIDGPAGVGDSASASVGVAVYPWDGAELELGAQLPLSQQARRAYDITGLARLGLAL